MLKTAFVIRRKWGLEILKEIYEFQKVRNDFKVDVLITTKKPEFKIDNFIKGKIKIYKVDPNNQQEIFEILTKHKIKIVFLYSWSHIINKSIIKKFLCLCLHPSLLPAYRGGTPIQHQLINGEKDSGATIFKMNEGIDAGDIYQQATMSLLGDINDIFSRMANLGTIITKNLIADYINGELVFRPQKNLRKSQVSKRRKPYQSRLTLGEINNIKYEKLNNMVRGLLDPYPNVFFEIANARIYIQEVMKYRKLRPRDIVIRRNTKLSNLKNKKIFLKVQDGYTWLVKYHLLFLGEQNSYEK